MSRSIQITVLILTLISAGYQTSGQVSEEAFNILKERVEKLMLDKDSLKQNYSAIESAGSKIEQKLLKIYQANFDEMEQAIRDAFDKTDVISVSTSYQEVIKSIILLHNEITKVNNFTDAQKVFGYDFIEQIESISEATLINEMIALSENESDVLKDKRKNKFKSIITSILNNPVLNGFIKSNPITSVAHSIINQTMSAQSTQITDVAITHGNYMMPTSFRDFKNGYTEFKSSYETSSLIGLPESKRLILDSSIDNFTSQLKPLIRLFDDLSKINGKFESSLMVFMKASEQTITRAKPIEVEFYRKLKVNSRNEARNKVNTFFNVGLNPNLETLESKLNNIEMKAALKYANEVSAVNILLKNDFLKILSLEIELSEEYIKFFEELKNGKKGLPKFENTEALEHKIDQFQKIKINLEDQARELEKK